MIQTQLLLVSGMALGPVMLFLLALLYLDSFKLVTFISVRFISVVGVVLLGGVTAVASYFVSGAVIDAAHVDFDHYSRYLAPVVEECLKAAVMIYLISRDRIGFMIDAAIYGVAIGAGFSMFENVYYYSVFPDSNLAVWMVRGLGTAIMHGGATAILGVTAQSLSERRAPFNPLNFLPGLIGAISLHSIFNQFTTWPLYSTAATIFILPLAVLFVFDKSEHQAHDWLIHDYESHEHLLAAIADGSFAHSAAGHLLSDIAERLGKANAEDIFAYLSLHTQLVLRAEQLLLARERGEDPMPQSQDRENFVKLHAVEQKIGRTAMLTIWPHLKFSHKELWELHQLENRT